MARICIDGFNLTLPSGSGIATYARNLVSAIAALGHDTQILLGPVRDLASDDLADQLGLFDPDTERVRFFHLWRWAGLVRPRAHEICLRADSIAPELASRFPPADRLWACRDIFRSANAAHRAVRRFTPLRLGSQIKTDIMHWTTALPLFEPRIANVYTLHDMIPLELPSTTLENRRAFYSMCRTIVKRADRVFTVSEHSRRDIVRLLGVSEARVVNTYQAVEVPRALRERPAADVARELTSRFQLEPQGYFLFFGALEPKKNLARLLEAYLSSSASVPLVIVGRAWLDRTQKAALERRGLETRVIPERSLAQSGRVRVIEYLPYGLLVTLIRGARATLFPSLYEGFGLPVLESMQLGTPVLASTAGSLPEIAGDAALLVDPYDIAAIRRGIEALDADAALREHLIDKGRRQAALFSTEAYRKRLQDAYAPLL